LAPIGKKRPQAQSIELGNRKATPNVPPKKHG